MQCEQKAWKAAFVDEAQDRRNDRARQCSAFGKNREAGAEILAATLPAGHLAGIFAIMKLGYRHLRRRGRRLWRQDGRR
jgi:hypothetical protein